MIFGTPTRHGLRTAQLKQFIDTTGPLWFKGELVNKPTSSLTSTATAHGGQESTLLALNNTFSHWGAIRKCRKFSAMVSCGLRRSG
jgi:NAD(P)H dehydrogenase (quinone)